MSSENKVVPIPRPPRHDDSAPENLLQTGGGGPHDPTMEQRVARLEIKLENVDRGLDRIDTRLDRIEDKIPSQWDIAKTMAAVLSFFLLAAFFVPRALSLLQ